MKTKSFLFAALVTISFATTSCQKEESIVPTTYRFSTEIPTTEIQGVATEEYGTADGQTQRLPKTQAVKDSVKINIIKVNTEEIN